MGHAEGLEQAAQQQFELLCCHAGFRRSQQLYLLRALTRGWTQTARPSNNSPQSKPSWPGKVGRRSVPGCSEPTSAWGRLLAAQAHRHASFSSPAPPRRARHPQPEQDSRAKEKGTA